MRVSLILKDVTPDVRKKSAQVECVCLRASRQEYIHSLLLCKACDEMMGVPLLSITQKGRGLDELSNHDRIKLRLEDNISSKVIGIFLHLTQGFVEQ